MILGPKKKKNTKKQCIYNICCCNRNSGCLNQTPTCPQHLTGEHNSTSRDRVEPRRALSRTGEESLGVTGGQRLARVGRARFARARPHRSAQLLAPILAGAKPEKYLASARSPFNGNAVFASLAPPGGHAPKRVSCAPASIVRRRVVVYASQSSTSK